MRRFATSPIGEGGPQLPDGFAELAFTSVADGFALSGACEGAVDGHRVFDDLGERGAQHEWGYGCGECPACQLRAKGWREYAARAT